jgi:hypothetical protein
MATSISAYFRCADGTFISLYNAGVTENTTTEIQTGGTGLNQVSGVSLGQAYVGKVLTHGIVKVSTEDSSAGVSLFNYIQTPSGSIGVVVQGAGADVSQLPPLCKAHRLAVGDTFQARFDAGADGNAQMAALSVYCSDGTCDVFFAQMVNNTKTSMVNKDGSTIGQALTNKVILKAFATSSTVFDINESNAGVGGYYIESADGMLKAIYPPITGNTGSSYQDFPFYQEYPVRILQNDTLSVMGSHS